MIQHIESKHYNEIKNKTDYQRWCDNNGYNSQELTIGQVIQCISEQGIFLEIKHFKNGWSIFDYSQPETPTNKPSVQDDLIEALWGVVKTLFL